MSDWLTIEAERVLYVDEGRNRILCDRLPSPVTLLVKRAQSPGSPSSGAGAQTPDTLTEGRTLGGEVEL